MPGTYRFTVAYDGTQYAGWQVQPNQVTIQSCLETAIEKTTGERVRITGSGRTDSGVHALAQVASCRLTNWNAPGPALARAINTGLPDDIVVHECQQVADDFHAIADATRKRYRYQLQLGGNRDPHLHRTWWHITHRIDLDSMRFAAQRIVGNRDFASFQASGAATEDSIRNVTACEILTEPHEPPNSAANPCHLIAVEVEANGFLYNMVRNIVGTLIEVGRGKRSPDWVSEVINAMNRNLAGPTAPAHGLFLKWVEYGSWRSDRKVSV